MKKNILLLSILLSVQLLHGQNQEKDSIKNLLAKAKDDTVRLSILDKLIFLKTWSNPEEALELAKQELLLAQKAKLSLAEAAALANNASVLSVLGDYSHAIEYYLQCIKLNEQFKNTRGLQFAYLNISESYSDAGDYNNAIMYVYKGKGVMDTIKSGSAPQVRMLTFAYIGEAYEKFGILDSAFFYLQKARAIDSIDFKKQSGFVALHLAATYEKKIS